MFHEHGDDDVDEHELGHQDEHDEEQTAHRGAAPSSERPHWFIARQQHDEEQTAHRGVAPRSERPYWFITRQPHDEEHRRDDGVDAAMQLLAADTVATCWC